MPTVTISETYDLSTKVNKMSIVAIHTPKKDIIQRLYPGLCMNYKYCHIDGIDVALASASVLPASPDQLGLDVDDIAPQDMFNPILYKAVSNDSFSTLEARIQMIAKGTSDPAVLTSGQMADIAKDDVTGVASDDFGVYYSLLSTPDGFKTAHPQRGLAMRNLVPLVFEKYYNIGENAGVTQSPVNGVPALGAGSGTSGSRPITVQTDAIHEMRGRPHRMPRFNTSFITIPIGTDIASASSGYSASGMSNAPVNIQYDMPTILPVMCGVILLPPAKRTLMFYRLHVRVRITFSEVRPITDVTTFGAMGTQLAPVVYHTDYASQSKDMDVTTDLVDVKDADLEKIMEGI